MNSKERANRYLQWMMRTPVISREHPQEVMLAKAFEEHAAEQRGACGDALLKTGFIHKGDSVYKACLNAVEKSDE